MAGDTEDPGGEILAAGIVAALLMLRYAAGLRRSAADRLDDLRAAILLEVIAADLAAIRQAPARQARAARLAAILDRLIAGAYADILADLQAELAALGQTVAEHDTATLRRVTQQPVEQPPQGSTAAAIGAAVIAGATLGAWMAKAAADTSFRVRGAVADAAHNGIGVVETATTIRLAADAAKSSTDTIIRSAASAASATATDRVIEANVGGAAKGWLWVSILDGRTTLECRSRANLRWDADRRPVGHTTLFRRPPIHPNCRSSLIPWVGGPAPREPTLSEFLASRPAAQAASLVGAKQWELFQAGKITQAQVLDQSSRPIALKTLRRLLGLDE